MSTLDDFRAPVELTAWMRGRLQTIVDKYVFEVCDGRPDVDTVALAPLGLRWTERGTADDWRCDRCGAYVPGDLVLVGLCPATWLRVMGGLCRPCAALEGVLA